MLLTHGTFSNHRSCRGLAQHLNKRGFDCWLLDNQGHGLSEPPLQAPDFEQMYLDDASAAVDFLKQRYNHQKLAWVGHSGGGLGALMYLAREPDRQATFSSIVTLASQATDAAVRPLNRSLIRLAQVTTRVLGYAPGHRLRLGPEAEFGAVMQQWYDWSLSGRWLGRDGFDYEASLPRVSVPTMMMAGSADRFIAPVSGCVRLFNQLGAEQSSFVRCGLDGGFSEDYSHARIISSRAAATDIWPLITSWLLDHD